MSDPDMILPVFSSFPVSSSPLNEHFANSAAFMLIPVIDTAPLQSDGSLHCKTSFTVSADMVCFVL